MLPKWPPLRTESEAFLHIDALRVVATLCVVIYHWRIYLDLQPGWLASFIGHFSTWASLVDIFFIISGIIISYVYEKRITSRDAFFDFLRKRMARLAPLHWAALAFCAAAFFIGTSMGHTFAEPKAYDFNCLLPNALLLHSYGVCESLTFNYPSWTISAELGCYLLFPLILLLLRVNVWLPALCALAMIVALSLAGPFGPDNTYWYDLDYFWSILRGLPAFAFGVTLYGIRGRLRIPLAGPLMYITLVAYLLIGQFGGERWLSQIVAYLLGVLAVAADSGAKADPFTRKLAPLGAITYPIYMLHMPVGATLVSVGATSLLELNGVALNFTVIACIPVLLLISYVSYVVYETPARRLLSGRSKKRQTQAQQRTPEGFVGAPPRQ